MSERRARQLAGPEEIEAALAAGRTGPPGAGSERCQRSAGERALRARPPGGNRGAGPASRASLWRLGKTDPPSEILALVGRDPHAPIEEVLSAGGAAWLLVGIAYPGNTGFAIRTAEVSGADGVFIDSDFEHEGRREAVRAAMRADRFMPVFWMPALPVIEAARAAGRRVLAVEDVGSRAPWEMGSGRVLRSSWSAANATESRQRCWRRATTRFGSRCWDSSRPTTCRPRWRRWPAKDCASSPRASALFLEAGPPVDRARDDEVNDDTMISSGSSFFGFYFPWYATGAKGGCAKI